MFIVIFWNFFKYNSDFDNLFVYGYYFYYIYLLINIFFLLGFAVVLIFVEFYRFCMLRLISYNLIFLCFFIFFSLILFLFFYQEFRFFFSFLFLGVIFYVFFINRIGYRNVFLFFWCVFNLIGLLFYGFFYQGGVIFFLLYIEKNLNNFSFFFINEDIFFFLYLYVFSIFIVQLYFCRIICGFIGIFNRGFGRCREILKNLLQLFSYIRYYDGGICVLENQF